MTEPDTQSITVSELSKANPVPLTQDRITFSGQFYHQQPDRDPMQIDIRYSRILANHDQGYMRDTEVGENSEPLDFGWVKNPGTIVIKTYPLKLPQNPSTEQIEAHKKGVLVLMDEDAVSGFMIHPGESLIVTPTNPDSLVIFSKHGIVRYTIYVFTE